MENHPDFESWFYTNYIQLYYQIGSPHKLNFYGLNLIHGVWGLLPTFGCGAHVAGDAAGDES